jgi:hypothetical protein
MPDMIGEWVDTIVNRVRAPTQDPVELTCWSPTCKPDSTSHAPVGRIPAEIAQGRCAAGRISN